MEDVAIIGGLIGVQVIYAGNAVLMSYLMSLGLTSLTIVIFTSFATFLILLPFAFYYERSLSLSLCLFLFTFSVLFWDHGKCLNFEDKFHLGVCIYLLQE